MFCIEVSKETKISDTMVLLRLFDYQVALTVRYHRLRSFYRRRLFAAYQKYSKKGLTNSPKCAAAVVTDWFLEVTTAALGLEVFCIFNPRRYSIYVS